MPHDKVMPVKAKLAMVFTIIVWASAFVGIRAGLSVYTPEELALLRYTAASLMMMVLYLFLPNKTRPTIRDILILILLGITGCTLYNIALGYSEEFLTAGEAGFIISINPMITAVLAVIFLREKMPAMAWLGVVISVLGVSLIAYAEVDAFQFNRGIIYAFIATFSFSLYCVIQKPLLKKYGSLELVALSIWAGTLLLLPYLSDTLVEIKKAPLSITLWIIYLGIFPAALAAVTWSYALKHGPITQVVSSIYMAPFVVTLMAWLILGEVPSVLAFIGGCIAVIGALMVYRIQSQG